MAHKPHANLKLTLVLPATDEFGRFQLKSSVIIIFPYQLIIEIYFGNPIYFAIEASYRWNYYCESTFSENGVMILFAVFLHFQEMKMRVNTSITIKAKRTHN